MVTTIRRIAMAVGSLVVFALAGGAHFKAG
jgi:hypothetical protein